ncbi:aspartyl-phosphate phosphatase Spo0E family protein [Paenibacillus agricola]|uniref:Spo0E family sporulation regulatory protein-aspartic acid phosphatase n=1 Tax=Paenibacillus agricola TaxID=2716264 RepID=A0ABX0J3W6_9BACL|nr:aspartyl-phosphate phosphatase Spo0E family protein [Paenibacillus agricola]NHN29518.1 Spo0E family sporulation regulatory protein-aspartic acid phosphatase [Paenibacillus agricola]
MNEEEFLMEEIRIKKTELIYAVEKAGYNLLDQKVVQISSELDIYIIRYQLIKM